ncbi:MAG: hypothetical protein ABIN95_02655 [Mucilaginibacter sp.]
MKKILSAVTILIACQTSVFAQKPALAEVKTVLSAEENFNKSVAKKGIKDAFLSVADIEGIVFKPNAVKIIDFYSNITKQPGNLSWEPKFARISANGDLAFTAGPYIYHSGNKEDDKVYGQYVSVWRADADNKLKLLLDLGIQHPEPEHEIITDFKEPDSAKLSMPSKDPFSGKNLILLTDKSFNQALTRSVIGSYKEFLSPEGRYYFPGFEPMTGQDQVMRFVENQSLDITAITINAGRAASNDLAYSYGTARIKKGDIVSNFNYVRIWEIDKTFKWNMLLEIYSAVENE